MCIHVDELNEIIHESRWAISLKCGDTIKKIFLHDAYNKIKKEVMLLQLSTGREAILSFDSSIGCWVCASDYIELKTVIGNIHLCELVKQIQDIIATWERDEGYQMLVSDEWSKCVVPWYCALLQEYIPNSDLLIEWLQNSRGEHFIHGDFTLGNVYLNQRDELIVLDYENATLGPLLWDETTLVYSLIEQNQLDAAKAIYDAFSCKKEMLRVICSVRLAQSIRKEQNVKQRKVVYDFVFQNY